MSFNPKQLPPTVYSSYKQGKENWLRTVDFAVSCGISNVNTLTNIIFYLHHPELNGRPLRSDETLLIAEWKAFKPSAILRLNVAKPLHVRSYDSIPTESISFNFSNITIE